MDVQATRGRYGTGWMHSSTACTCLLGSGVLVRQVRCRRSVCGIAPVGEASPPDGRARRAFLDATISHATESFRVPRRHGHTTASQRAPATVPVSTTHATPGAVVPALVACCECLYGACKSLAVCEEAIMHACALGTSRAGHARATGSRFMRPLYNTTTSASAVGWAQPTGMDHRPRTPLERTNMYRDAPVPRLLPLLHAQCTGPREIRGVLLAKMTAADRASFAFAACRHAPSRRAGRLLTSPSASAAKNPPPAARPAQPQRSTQRGAHETETRARDANRPRGTVRCRCGGDGLDASTTAHATGRCQWLPRRFQLRRATRAK